MKQNRNSSPPTSLDHEKRLRALENKGGGGHNGGMWEQTVETRLSELRADIKDHRGATDRDFRILFGAIIALALGLSGLMAKGFGWL